MAYFFGQFTHSIPIQVPACRSITPQVSLQYLSGERNGFVGVGWTLGGISVIERASENLGAASYIDGSGPYMPLGEDTFLLDGAALVRCISGSVSPSCNNPDGSGSGVYYSTKIESYMRIKHDLVADTWTIWARDGSRSTYMPKYLVTPSSSLIPMTFRWVLTSVADTCGNTITHSWSCDGLDCYPDTITYNRTTVRFYRESRADTVAFANGVSLGQTTQRLKAIEVNVNGSVARVYALGYLPSMVSTRSLLTSVQQYGTDALVDSSGSITRGTPLPAASFGYTAGGAPFDGAANLWSTTAASGDASGAGYVWLSGDFNIDGKTDLLLYRGSDSSARVGLSTGSGFNWTLYSQTIGFGDNSQDQWFVGDFDGDGRSDVAFFHGSDGMTWVGRTKTTGSCTWPGDGAYHGAPCFDWTGWSQTMFTSCYDGGMMQGDFTATARWTWRTIARPQERSRSGFRTAAPSSGVVRPCAAVAEHRRALLC